jgi:DNA-binding transcriptional LysR family regulator
MLRAAALMNLFLQTRIALAQHCGRLNLECSSFMNDLDLNDVRTFVAVSQAGTLTAAAKQLQLPTSTVSRALTRLEKHLGFLLVQRSPRGLVLTDSGKEYLQSCRRALQTLRHGGALLEGRRSNPSGLIKVACPVTMARDVFAPLLKEFLGRYPDLRMEIKPYSASWDQEPREDVDVFFKLRAPRDSLRRVRPYPGTARGLFASPGVWRQLLLRVSDNYFCGSTTTTTLTNFRWPAYAGSDRSRG